jgi:predicted transposase YdaD
MEKGMERGREEREIEIARNLLKSNLSPEFISENIGLTIEEIKTLKNQN